MRESTRPIEPGRHECRYRRLDPRNPLTVLAMLAALALVAAACGGDTTSTGVAESGTGSSDDAASDTDGTDGSGDGTGDDSDVGPGTTAADNGDGDGADDGDGDGDGTGDDGSGDDGDGGGDGDGTGPLPGASVAAYQPGAFDPPTGPAPFPLLLYNADGAYRLDDNGLTQIVDGPIAEAVDDGDGGILFQREPRSEIIWWQAVDTDQPVDLLVTVAPVHLVLEGVVGSGPSRRIAYQRVAETGQVETSIHRLKTYRFDDATVEDVAVVGGWEAATHISSVVDGVAAGVWGGEGYNSYFVHDLASGGTFGERPEDHWIDHVSHEAAYDGSQLVALGALWDEADEVYYEMGLYRVGLDGQVQDLITTFPWDNGHWYPTGMFVEGGWAIISRDRDPFIEGAGTPLGPLMVDLATGQATTLPYAVYAASVGLG